MARTRSRAPAFSSRSVFPRERLFAWLDRAQPQSLVWLTAPAGAGKTTLISSYLAARGVTGLWHTLHAGESDPATFFNHLGQAVRDQFARRRFSLPALTPECFAGLAAFAHRYFARLYERLPHPVVVVIDDCHELSDGSPVHGILAEGFSHLPPQVRAIVISRNPPPPDFARLQVNRSMEILRWPELRLTEAETAGLIRHLAHGSDLADRARFLHERAGGWVAGVILLLADEVRTSGDIPVSGNQGRDTLFDFFAGEIFNRLDVTEQAVLRRCALLEETTAHMAERLSGDKGAGRVLEQLYRRQCFIDRRDGAEPVYRWHALFRQFLLSRDAAMSTPQEQLQSRYAAARVLEEEGRTEGAIEQYRQALAWPDLIRILLAEAPGWIAGGRHQMLAYWIDAIPGSLFEQVPWLSYWRGVCRFPFDPIESRTWFERAFEQFAAADLPDGLFLSWSGVVETFLACWDDYTGLDRWIEWLDRRFARTAGALPPEVEARVTLAMFTALIFRQPDHRDLEAWFARLRRLVETATDPQLQVLGLFSGALYLLWIGHVAEAGVLVERLKQSARHFRVSPAFTLQRKVTEAAHAWFVADFKTAFQMVDDGLAMAEEAGAHLWDHRLLSQGAYAALSLGDLEKAGAYLVRMSAATHPARRLDVAHHHLLRAWEMFQHRDFPGALEHARTAVRLAVEMGTPFPEALCHQGTAQILIAMGRHDEARAEVERMRQIGCAMKSDYLEFVAGLIEAHVWMQTGTDLQRVRECLRRALPFGRNHGFANVPFWDPGMMSRLCGVALEAEIEIGYVCSLITRRGLLPDADSRHLEAWPWRYRIFTLGGFRLLHDGKPVSFPKKVPRKPLDLLKLLAADSSGMSRERLEDALWPDADGDQARHALETALYRLRRLLLPEAIEVDDSRLRLNPRCCWTDIGALESLLAQIGSRIPQHGGNPEEITRLAHGIYRLYAGPYLAGVSARWAESGRERLHRRWCRHLEQFGQWLERQDRWEEAADCYRRALEGAPHTEAFYRALIAACERLGRAAEAEAVRQHFGKAFLRPE
ncbi:MAG: BTAD domain-containing putative transcriptional regulator [Acidiferrobacterales bacterium]